MAHRTVAKEVVHEELIEGSRFIAYVAPVASIEEAEAQLAEARREHPDATHHCWAYRLGEVQRFNDDGEPGGTAGRPMLEVMLKRDLNMLSAVVVRYFGGRKLGAGGLVRAYTDAVAQALRDADKVAIVKQLLLRCAVPYALEGMMRREIDSVGAKLLEVAHGDEVELAFSIPETDSARFLERLNESGQGRIVWRQAE